MLHPLFKIKNLSENKNTSIYTFCDTSNRLQTSALVVLSVLLNISTVVVVGFDIIDTWNPNNSYKQLATHWVMLRNRFPNFGIVVGCETGSGYTSGDIYNIALLSVDNIKVMREGFTHGIVMTDSKLCRMKDCVNKLLNKNKIITIEDCTTSTYHSVNLLNELCSNNVFCLQTVIYIMRLNWEYLYKMDLVHALMTSKIARLGKKSSVKKLPRDLCPLIFKMIKCKH